MGPSSGAVGMIFDGRSTRLFVAVTLKFNSTTCEGDV